MTAAIVRSCAWIGFAAVAGCQKPPAPMASITGGTFTMGSDDKDAIESEKPPHTVTVRAFRIDKTEVTIEAYARCVKAQRCTEPLSFVDEKKNFRIFCNWKHPEGRRMHPVNCVNWSQATAFCTFAGKRLPTEEEWEFAARAGSEERKYPWGDSPPDPSRVNGCAAECEADLKAKGFPVGPPLFPSSDGFAETAPVGTYPDGASKDGLLDLSGNVWEWTDSAYAHYGGSPTDDKRVLRGGSFGAWDARTLRAAYRFRLPPSSQSEFLGFRCAK
jgi:eukaryotic-like serine/threonine-protein kinase